MVTGRLAPEAYSVRRRSGFLREIAAIAALSLIAVFYITLCMDRSIPVYDEGLIVVGATRVADGAIPHRDFYFLYGPGQIYVLAGLFKVFGASLLVERAWDTLVRCCIVVLVMIVVRQAAPRWLAILTAAVSMVWLASLGYCGYPVFPALAAALAGLAFLAPTLGRVGPVSRLVAGGMCAGVAMLFRYDIGAATFAVYVVILAFSGWFQRVDRARRYRIAFLSVFWFGAGFAILVVPVAAAYAFYGVIPDLAFQVVAFPARYYAKTRSLPFPRLWVLRAHPAQFIGIYLPLFLCAACVPTLVVLARSRRKDNDAAAAGPRLSAWVALPWTLLLLIVVTLVFYGKGVVRVSLLHLAMPLVSSLAMAGILAQPIPGRGLVGRFMVVAGVVGIAFVTLSALQTDLQHASENVAWASDPAAWQLAPTAIPPTSGSCRVPTGFERMACFPMSAETIETVRYVQQRTGPTDPVFVGLPRHDSVFVDDVMLYFAMNRTPATKWYQFDPGLQTSAPIQQAMVDELQRAKPKLIVIDATWLDYREQNDSALSSGVTLLDDYLVRAFEPVATFGAKTILRPRSPAPP